MTLSPVVHRTLQQLIEREAPEHAEPSGALDKEGLVDAVGLLLPEDEPDVARLAYAEAYRHLIEGEVGWWIRNAKSSVVRAHLEAEEIEAAADAQRERLAIPNGDGGYTIKRRVDCTRADLRRVLTHRVTLLRAQAREVRWLRRTLRHMEQLGLPEEATVSDLGSNAVGW